MTNLPEQLGFTTAYYDLPGLRLHAAVAGPEAGPLVVLLHGFPEFWYCWRNQIGPLAAAGFRVITPDQRGYNLTDKTLPYDLKTVTDDMDHLIQAAGRQTAHIVGHDWGGAVAWALAAWHPERVQRLVAINLPHPLALGAALRHMNLTQYLRSWYIGLFQIRGVPEWLLRRRNFATLRQLRHGTTRPDAFSDTDIEHYAQAWSQPGALSAMLGWYRAVGQSRKQVGAARQKFEHIRPPTLILWGERDIALGVELAEASLAFLDDGRLVRFPKATHWLPAEEPEQVSQHLLAHLTA